MNIRCHNADDPTALLPEAFDDDFVNRLGFTEQSRDIYFAEPPFDAKGRDSWGGMAVYDTDQLLISTKHLQRYRANVRQRQIDNLRSTYCHEVAHFVAPRQGHNCVFLAVYLTLLNRGLDAADEDRLTHINFYDMKDDLGTHDSAAKLAWAWDFAKSHHSSGVKAEKLGELALADLEAKGLLIARSSNMTFDEFSSLERERAWAVEEKNIVEVKLENERKLTKALKSRLKSNGSMYRAKLRELQRASDIYKHISVCVVTFSFTIALLMKIEP